MDDEEFDFQSEQFATCSFDIDEFLSRTQSCNEALGRTEACADVFGPSQACTHAHACHPSGPDKSHTHTCIHVHTQIMPTSDEFQDPSSDTAKCAENAKKRPLGNRQAVRKYREKKKARTESLEDEVVRLRALNQQLMKRLQCQDSLESEVARLKCLLVDIRGRIEGEIGSYPYKKTAKNPDIYPPVDNTNLSSTNVMAPCRVQCHDQINCLGPRPEAVVLNSQNLDDCVFENLQYPGARDSNQNMLPQARIWEY